MSLLFACTVCYGDPASPLSKGAVAGVLVLGVAIGGVLATFAGLFWFWSKRARALDAATLSPTPATAILPPADPLPKGSPREPASLTLH